METRDFKGIVPALITPMNSDGGLNQESLRAAFGFNVEVGLSGFWVAAGAEGSI